MVPKKANDFKKPTADELGLPEDLVSDFVDFFWDRVRTHMSKLDYETLLIPNLGTFKVKHWKIDETVKTYAEIITKVEGRFSEYKVKMDLTDRIEKLEKIKLSAQKREEKFKKIKNARKNKENMEEQNSDMGRPQEPDIQD